MMASTIVVIFTSGSSRNTSLSSLLFYQYKVFAQIKCTYLQLLHILASAFKSFCLPFHVRPFNPVNKIFNRTFRCLPSSVEPSLIATVDTAFAACVFIFHEGDSRALFNVSHITSIFCRIPVSVPGLFSDQMSVHISTVCSVSILKILIISILYMTHAPNKYLVFFQHALQKIPTEEQPPNDFSVSLDCGYQLIESYTHKLIVLNHPLVQNT